MTVKQRNKLLAEMTDEVGALVLRNNYAQNIALANAVAQAPSLLHAQQRFMRRLERDGHLDRALEFLPTDRQIRERLTAGRGLTQPELAVLLAYTKITVADELIRTELPDDPYLRRLLHAYFPKALRERVPRADRRARAAPRDHHHRAGQRHRQHRRSPPSCTGCGRRPGPPPRRSSGRRPRPARSSSSAAVWDEVEALDNVVAADVQTRIRLHSRRLVERGTRWLLDNRPQPLELAETIDFFSERVAEVWAELPKLLRGGDLEWYQRSCDELTAAGVPDELAGRVAGFSVGLPGAGHRRRRRPHRQGRRWPSPRSTTTSPTGCGSPSSWTGSSNCRAPTAGSPWPAPPSARTCTRRTPRSPPTCWRRATGSATPEQRFKAWEQKNAAILEPGAYHPGGDPGVGVLRPGEPVGGDADDADAAAHPRLTVEAGPSGRPLGARGIVLRARELAVLGPAARPAGPGQPRWHTGVAVGRAADGGRSAVRSHGPGTGK